MKKQKGLFKTVTIEQNGLHGTKYLVITGFWKSWNHICMKVTMTKKDIEKMYECNAYCLPKSINKTNTFLVPIEWIFETEDDALLNVCYGWI